MENALQKLSQLKRPKVLNTAVRLGLPQYKRQKELSRILGFKFEGSDKELITIFSKLRRQSMSNVCSMIRFIEWLITLMY